MKIELKFSNDELMLINNQLQEAYTLHSNQAALYNVVLSIVLELADRFTSKVKSRLKKSNLFEKKKVKMTFKFHEAWALKTFLYDQVQQLDAEDHYARTLLNKQIGIIDQLLK